MKILASLLIVLAVGAGCASRTVVYTPAPAPATVVMTPTVTTPAYVVTYDRASCKAAGGRWHSFANRCDF
jgi:hypothetical protein